MHGLRQVTHNFHPGSRGVHDKGDNEAVQTQDLGENEDKDLHEESAEVNKSVSR